MQTQISSLAVFGDHTHVFLLSGVALVGLMLLMLFRRGAAVPYALAARLASTTPPARPIGWHNAVVHLFLFGLLLTALARPRWGAEQAVAAADNRICWLVVDVSRSMLARDAPGNRLEHAKTLLRATLADLAGYRVGVLAFSGASRLLVPPTRDLDFVATRLRHLSIDDAPGGGSDWSKPLQWLAARQHEPTLGVMLVTDGGHAPFPTSAAVNAALHANLVVWVVGVGDPTATQEIRLEDGQPLLQRGQPVKSRLEESPLEQLATASGGVYLAARTQPIDLGGVLRNRLAPRFAADARSRKPVERYQWFLLPACALAAAVGRGRFAKWPMVMSVGWFIPIGLLLVAASTAADDRAVYERARSAVAAGDEATAIGGFTALADRPPPLRRFARFGLATTFAQFADSAPDPAVQLGQAVLLYRALIDDGVRDAAGDACQNNLAWCKRRLEARQETASGDRPRRANSQAKAKAETTRESDAEPDRGKSRPVSRDPPSQNTKQLGGAIAQEMAGLTIADPGSLTPTQAIEGLGKAVARNSELLRQRKASAPRPRLPGDY